MRRATCSCRRNFSTGPASAPTTHFLAKGSPRISLSRNRSRQVCATFSRRQPGSWTSDRPAPPQRVGRYARIIGAWLALNSGETSKTTKPRADRRAPRRPGLSAGPQRGPRGIVGSPVCKITPPASNVTSRGDTKTAVAPAMMRTAKATRAYGGRDGVGRSRSAGPASGAGTEPRWFAAMRAAPQLVMASRRNRTIPPSTHSPRPAAFRATGAGATSSRVKRAGAAPSRCPDRAKTTSNGE